MKAVLHVDVNITPIATAVDLDEERGAKLEGRGVHDWDE